ncbi:AzlC family ABC transporter permease [Facklamia miroungae]|uniref:4-azaleucine resistance probable transporter AzlC n=1 Tax=Facklamia miroungae TaxID=120956 RepID=A0A1G7UNT7_9LACT|nr:AzlC family ABC transporter permease [Facklamia miroungae]NKZ30183.1 branched-chain amino acid transporter AzlC [Facklamia miroungae]SDG49147.1 4-azaleucine resistance probable transporter AzlC [Facklamia miroungae]
MNKKYWAYAFEKTLPIGLVYLMLALGFGIMMQAKGFSWIWALCLSLFVYSGSIQFLAPVILSSGTGFFDTFILTFMVNFRLLFYGISQLERYKHIKGWRKIYLIHGLTDETFALVSTDQLPEGIDREKYSLYVTLLNHMYWISGSILGNLAGDLLPFSTEGIDFALTALFFVVVLNQWEATNNHKPALLGVMSGFFFFIIFGPDNFMLPSMLVVIAFLLIENRLKGGHPDYV